MSNPTGPDRPDEPNETDQEPATEVFAPAEPSDAPEPPQSGERRYTAPSGFDAGSTQIINRPSEPATEVFDTGAQAETEVFATQNVAPQKIPPRGEAPKPPGKKRSWGWVIAIVLVIAALAAVAILGTILLTRGSSAAASQEDEVRSTIQDFDVAVQNGDLATLRSITCGTTRDSYVGYNDKSWEQTHARVAAAKQYPVVASIDQVVVNDDHAEANVTTFMAYAPQTRSTRSFDLHYQDEQWKICQAPGS
jgi:flagellar basal body-associated protein FliL